MNQPLNKIFVVKSLISKYQEAGKTAAEPYEIRAEKIWLFLVCLIIATSLFIWGDYERWISILLIPIYVFIRTATKNLPERFLAKIIWGKKIRRSKIKIQDENKKELLLYRKHLILMTKRHKNWVEVHKQASKIIDIDK